MNPYETLSTYQNYAVLGLNDDPSKYVYKIYRLLKEKGKTVYGVNPKYDTVDGDHVYDHVSDITEPVDIAVFVVNPRIGIHYLETIKQQGIETIWLQPGTIDDALLLRAQELELNVIEACVLAVYAINEPKSN